MSSEVDSNWYLYMAVGRVGPLTLKEAQELASRGALRPQDLAWCPGMPAWVKVSELEDLLQAPAKPSLAGHDLNTLAEAVAAAEPTDTTSSAEGPIAPSVTEQKKRFALRLPKAAKTVGLSLSLSLALGALTYFAYPVVNDWLSGFPRLPELPQGQYALLRSTAKADLKTQGPKVDMVSLFRSDGGTTFYIATNLSDHTGFDLSFQPIAETLVGEPRTIELLHVSSRQHLARAGLPSVPPGYYWVDLSAPQHNELSIHRKMFVGGVPDSNYESHLNDYTAVRRGVAKAELGRMREALTRVESLMAAENKAAESLSTMRFNQAKAQAWEIFQETWGRGLGQIQALLNKPSRYSGKLLREAQTIQEPLKKLHDKHHDLLTAVVTPASRQLAPGAVTTARVFADAHMISGEISAKIKSLRQELDEREKLFDNPLYRLVEEP
ncbi:MAG: DUF4339 domain-containing protein [Bdellovibrionia bacterium]